MAEVLFIAANLSITLAYWFIAAAIAPGFKMPSWGIVGAVMFFITCGLTHLEIAAHTALTAEGFTKDELLSWHSLLIHIPQAMFVWMFVAGLTTVRISPATVDE